jgi:WD40 repeat protein
MEPDLKITTRFTQPIVTWCESQPLFAVHAIDFNAVEIYRFTFEVEKIIERDMLSQPTCVKFTLDGCLCAVGFADGNIGIYKTDSMQEIVKSKSNAPQQILFKFLEPHRSHDPLGLPTLQQLDSKLSDQMKLRLAMQNMLTIACDNQCLSVAFNGTELFSYSLDLSSAPTKLASHQNEIIVVTSR